MMRGLVRNDLNIDTLPLTRSMLSFLGMVIPITDVDTCYGIYDESEITAVGWRWYGNNFQWIKQGGEIIYLNEDFIKNDSEQIKALEALSDL